MASFYRGQVLYYPAGRARIGIRPSVFIASALREHPANRRKLRATVLATPVAFAAAMLLLLLLLCQRCRRHSSSMLESIHFTRVSSLNCTPVVLSVECAENGEGRWRRAKGTRGLADDVEQRVGWWLLRCSSLPPRLGKWECRTSPRRDLEWACERT